MPPMEPNFKANTGHDALRVWMDFWDFTGSLRVDIIRRSGSNGDPAKMIAAVISETVIASVPAIVVDREESPYPDRAGEIPAGKIKIELIDTVRETDWLKMNDVEYEVDSVEEQGMGNFAIWVVKARRVD